MAYRTFGMTRQLRLYMQKKTAKIAVRNKRTWHLPVLWSTV